MKLLQQLRKPIDERERGAAMMLAIVFAMVMIGLVLYMTVLAMKSLDKGQSAQSLNASMNAADSAISNMQAFASSKGSVSVDIFKQHLGPENAVYGTYQANENNESGDGAYAWRWYAEANSSKGPGMSYYVYATGYQKNPNDADARTLMVTMDSTVTEGVEYDSSGKIVYVSTNAGAFAFNALGTSSFQMGKNSGSYTYDSEKNIGYPVSSLGNGTIATNTKLAAEQGATGGVSFMRSDVDPGSDVGTVLLSELCTGAGCNNLTATLYSYSVSLSKSLKDFDAACPVSGGPYPDWKASENGGVLPTGNGSQCYNNVTFDTDTSLSAMWSTGNPLRMYVGGNVTVNPGVEVAKQKYSSHGAYAFQLVSGGNGKFLMENGTNSNDPTKFTGTVVGAQTSCDIGGPSTNTTANMAVVYGSVACKDVTMRAGTAIWRDLQLDKVQKDGSAQARKVWVSTSYAEV